MKIGIIIIDPLSIFVKDFLFSVIEKETPYHLCFVKNKKNCQETFKILEEKAKEDNIDISIVHNKNKHLLHFKAAYGYLESRNDINKIIVVEKKENSLINNMDAFINNINSSF